MDAALGSLLEHLTAIGRELSADAVQALAQELRAVPGPRSFSPASGSTARTRALRERLKELWRDNEDVTPNEMAIGLLSAQRAAETVESSQIVELLWTGPTTSSVPVRRTDQALYELIESAERDLLIVSFAAYKVPRVIEAVSRALARGIRTRFVLESEEASGGKVRFDPSGALGSLAATVQIYSWPMEKRDPDARGRRGALHAKCAVADDDLAVISSANLTEHALALNMELGLLIRGGAVPRRIAEHFAQLIARGILQLSHPDQTP